MRPKRLRKSKYDGVTDVEYVLARSIPVPHSGCWIWLGPILRNGYGAFDRGARDVGRSHLAHRLAFEAFTGSIPSEACIDRLCRIRCCVNPAHLEAVTQRENIVRGVGPQRARQRLLALTHCVRGHPFSGANLGLRSNGTRYCMECHRRWSAELRARRAAMHQAIGI